MDYINPYDRERLKKKTFSLGQQDNDTQPVCPFWLENTVYKSEKKPHWEKNSICVWLHIFGEKGFVALHSPVQKVTEMIVTRMTKESSMRKKLKPLRTFSPPHTWPLAAGWQTLRNPPSLVNALVSHMSPPPLRSMCWSMNRWSQPRYPHRCHR